MKSKGYLFAKIDTRCTPWWNIYFLRLPDGLIKIGRTHNLGERLSTFRTSERIGSEEVTLLGLIPTYHREVEQIFLSLLSEFRIGGLELFACSSDEIQEAMFLWLTGSTRLLKAWQAKRPLPAIHRKKTA